MTMEKFKEWVVAKMKDHPKHKEQIMDFYTLCMDEIENGESPSNEIHLCMEDIEQLIKGESI